MDAQPASILVVDDEDAIRDLCARVLGRTYRVRAVADGPAAVEAARDDPPDLLLTDIRMPGMSGLDAARRIVADHPEVSVVVMTGFSELDSLLETVKLGVSGFLMKPFTPDDLRRTVEEGLRKGLYFRRNARLRALQPLLDLRSARPGDVEPARLFRVITETVLHELEADAVSLVCLEDGGSEVLVTTSTAGPAGPTTVQGDGAASSSVRLSAEDLLAAAAPAPDDDGRTLSAPLQVAGSVVGILTASRSEPFGAVDRDILRVIAAQGAIAIENIRLFHRLRRSYWKTVYALAATVDLRDQPTRGHSDRLAQYAVAMGARLGLPADRLEDLKIAALLHDIGKIGIGDAILRKPTELTPEEYDWMKTHTLMGAKILAMADFPPRVVEAVLFHHERFDGTGYPLGLRGDQIPLEARILAGADALESMTSTRAYRAALPLAQALQELERGRGTQFDPQVLDALLACLRAGELAPLVLAEAAPVAGEGER
ncbi:MAG: response regulator [Armatimonadota bacterium]|nr:response regulator [Armatimonadota bacterium]MDR7401539.1 response regulator [Armatimonadota bacterium]MDR7403281.1 response regulator [Armatimonadota bacterium]MDR7437649.1 response regulator [Armatimonadota bacterium]MDR7471653.1 response regulator [Armatimonadota bacterium]